MNDYHNCEQCWHERKDRDTSSRKLIRQQKVFTTMSSRDQHDKNFHTLISLLSADELLSELDCATAEVDAFYLPEKVHLHIAMSRLMRQIVFDFGTQVHVRVAPWDPLEDLPLPTVRDPNGKPFFENTLLTFPAGTLTSFPLLVHTGTGYGSWRHHVTFFFAQAHHDEAVELYNELMAQAKQEFYRPGVYHFRRENDLRLEEIDFETNVDRYLVLPDNIINKVTGQIKLLLSRLDDLRGTGLGMNFGIILEGPPGVGKTALCKYIAWQLRKELTTLVVDSKVINDNEREIYSIAEAMAPCVVVLEDIDRIYGTSQNNDDGPGFSRYRGDPNVKDLLAALDGFETKNNGVITIATVNNIHNLDKALLRAARFDNIVQFPPPDDDLRIEIFKSYLQDFECSDDIDWDYLARETRQTTRKPEREPRSVTGAEIREIVRLAVIRRGQPVTHAALVEAIEDASWKVLREHYGVYL